MAQAENAPKTKVVTKEKTVPGISPEIISELSEEINNMLSYAVFRGITINTEINKLVENSSVDDLINAHNLLCANIAPATPKSIKYTKELRVNGIDKSLFQRLPIVRNLILLALLFLLGFILTGLSPDVNNDSLDLGILANHGMSLLLNLTFIASISGLGVIFYLLKSVSTSLKSGTLVPEDSVYYAALIVLGIIAGLILSEILTLNSGGSNQSNINLFNKSVLALLGGFSSDAIFSILQTVIDKIKDIFTSSN